MPDGAAFFYIGGGHAFRVGDNRKHTEFRKLLHALRWSN